MVTTIFFPLTSAVIVLSFLRPWPCLYLLAPIETTVKAEAQQNGECRNSTPLKPINKNRKMMQVVDVILVVLVLGVIAQVYLCVYACVRSASATETTLTEVTVPCELMGADSMNLPSQ